MEPDEMPVSLHGVFWAAADEQRGLTEATKDWYEAMSRNPGFLGGVMVSPAGTEQLEARGPAIAQLLRSHDVARAAAPWGGASHAIETTSFWRTEADRAAWALTPAHDPAFAAVTGRVTDRISNRLELVHLHGSPAGASITDHNIYTTADAAEAEQLQRDLLEVAVSAAAAPGLCCLVLLRPLPSEQRTTFTSRDELLPLVGGHSEETESSMHTIEVMSYWRSETDRAAWKAAADRQQPASAHLRTKHGVSTVHQSWGPQVSSGSNQPRL